MKAVKCELSAKLQADLTPLDHVSFNLMFTGFSRRWQTKLFVKVFTPERVGKFSMERAVNQQLNTRVLMSGQLTSGEWFLAMRDIPVVPVPKIVTPALARQMGTVLAQFHHRVKLAATDSQPRDELSSVAAKIADLSGNPDYEQLRDLMASYKQNRAEIETELALAKLVALHGDVGCRNYQVVDGTLVLIDFERVHLGVPQADFQKLFYQDFLGKPALQQAFLAGYGPLPELSPLTASWLLFQPAVGIFSYLQRLPDAQFELVGHRLLAAAMAQLP